MFNTTFLHCNRRQKSIIIVTDNRLHPWCFTFLNLHRAKSAALICSGKSGGGCVVGMFASLGGRCCSGGSLADRAPRRIMPFHWRKLATFLFVQNGDNPFFSLSPCTSRFLRFRHLKHEGKQEVNSAIL